MSLSESQILRLRIRRILDVITCAEPGARLVVDVKLENTSLTILREIYEYLTLEQLDLEKRIAYEITRQVGA